MTLSFTKLPLILTVLASPLCKSETQDFINFENGDTLHGDFLGFTTTGKVIWKNSQAEKNIAFSTTELNKVVFNRGQLKKPFTHQSYITLTNLDIIPGEIIKMDDEFVSVKTDFAGEFKITNDQISSITFQPLGDKILFRGPYSEDGWSALPFKSKKADAKKETQKTDKKKQGKKDGWTFSSFTWSHLDIPSILMSDMELPDKFRYTFSWESFNNGYLNLALFADMKPPTDEDGNALDKKNTNRAGKIANVIGTSLSLRITSHSSSLVFYGFDKEGNPYSSTLTNLIQYRPNNTARDSKTKFDVRVDRETQSIFVYKMGALIGEWSLSEIDDQLTGNKLGYFVEYSGTGRMQKVSDMTLSSWNGIIDPAITIDNNDRDIVMLSNGTDRFSGDTQKIVDGKLDLKGPFAELEIPTDQIQMLSFAKKNRADPVPPTGNDVAIRFYGTGKITGAISKGPDGTIIIENSTIGKLKIDFNYITSIQFTDLDYIYEIE